MDECKSMGLQVLGPDVNESHRKFGVNKKGDIRFGLAAIKGAGAGAVQNIIDEREKNGPYKDIYDFIERVNLSACNKKVIESLALSGAFDNLGVRREPFVTPNEKGETFTEIISRYGTKYQIDKQMSMNSLFGADAAIDIAKPGAPKCNEWSDLERLNKEKDLIGIYLSAHPLDAYRVILTYVCNTGMADIGNREELKNKELLLGGIVTAYREGTTKRGSPYGILTLEDFTGSGEIPLFGNDYINYGKFGKLGMYLFIRAAVEVRNAHVNMLDLKIKMITLLQDEKDRLIRKLNISLSVDELNDTLIEELASLLQNSKGTASLFFNVFDETRHVSLRFVSKNRGVEVTQKLVNALSDMESIRFTIN
jgi:DNA polymerase-3 subunit alpha